MILHGLTDQDPDVGSTCLVAIASFRTDILAYLQFSCLTLRLLFKTHLLASKIAFSCHGLLFSVLLYKSHFQGLIQMNPISTVELNLSLRPEERLDVWIITGLTR